MSVSVYLGIPEPALAHIIHDDGPWTFRYLTRKTWDACGRMDGASDPLNVLFWQYGAGDRMNNHANADTAWGFYPSQVPRADQWICGDSNAQRGTYIANDYLNFDDQEGHGSSSNTVRAHFRIFYAPHSHSIDSDKWSIIDSHHEHIDKSTSTVLTHHIDEDWEKREYIIGADFADSGHSFWYDYWVRQGGQYLQGFYDDGSISRVGGLHNGSY